MASSTNSKRNRVGFILVEPSLTDRSGSPLHQHEVVATSGRCQGGTGKPHADGVASAQRHSHNRGLVHSDFGCDPEAG